MRRRRLLKPDEIQIDMTPMLDIVFIMLIFFIVTSTLGQQKSIKVNTPTAVSGQSRAAQPELVTISADDAIFVGRRQVSLTELSGILLQKVASDPKVSLLIDADKLSHHGIVIKVMDVAKSVGVSKVAMAVNPGAE
ncbi:ExbD/TolR family protein [Dongshaea marina]|uniref:ExbD/TolR family protein n=1 Tax=Dongshaea marina TaxID=2047966 RepID=UPI000D3E62D8|nr:biopolymer transporter ExbD [Dongshaea marina]